MTERKEVIFTLHVEDKLRRLVRMGITKAKILEIIENPERVIDGYYGRKIAQGLLNEDLILRVVYEESELVVTVYLGERRRYE